MSRRSRFLLWIAISVAGVLGTAISTFHYYSNRSAVPTALAWARLDPLPSSATEVHADVKGSMFTREFVVTFVASVGDIDNWLRSSPETASLTPERAGTLRKYQIAPGEGAAFAEVTFDERTGRVVIHTYWS